MSGAPLKNRPQDESTIRSKLRLGMLITAVSGLVVASLVSTVYMVFDYERDVIENLQIHARRTGDSCIPGLQTNNEDDLQKVLSGLTYIPNFESCAVYSAAGLPVAEFVAREGAQRTLQMDLKDPVNYNVRQNFLIVNEPVLTSDRMYVGTVSITCNLDTLYNTLWNGLKSILVATGIATVVAYFVSWGFQKMISKPLESLSDMARIIAQTADFSLRATVNSTDEIGRLAVDFNHMISEVQTRDQELLSNENRFRALVDQAVDSIYLIQENGAVVDCNPMACTSLGYRKKELLEKSFVDLVPELNLEEFIDLSQRAVAGDHPMLETSQRSCRGKEIPMEIKLGAIELKGEQLLIAYCRDHTERVKVETQLKESEERLRQAKKMESIGQLAGGVAHDFNNMLAGIIGSAELLRRPERREGQHRKYVDLILSTAGRAADLTEKLLAFSRKGKVLTQVFDLHAVVRDAVAILGRSIDRRIVIYEECHARHPLVMGDPAQLQSAILNLGINARDAMEGEGQLIFRSCNLTMSNAACAESVFDILPGEYVSLEIQDTGCGIDPDLLQKIFEPFFTTKGVGEGTGMGLAAVYGTVKDHRGSIEVESRQGMGATFRISLPVTDAAALSTEVVVENPDAMLEGRCVLLVDDEDPLRILGREFLEQLGCEVFTAADGMEALVAYKEFGERIDLVILDMVMPNMNGESCFYELRRLDPDVQVMFVSGFTKSADNPVLKEPNVVDFLKKPFREQAFQETVSAALTKVRHLV